MMLGSLKQIGKNVGHEVGRGESLSEGWHELLSRGSGVLTHFSHRKDEGQPESAALSGLPRWSLLDIDKAQATCTNGVLTVRLPKGSPTKTRFIRVS